VGIAHPSACQKTVRLSKITQDKAQGFANEGTYFVYVTEICKFLQCSKQKSIGFLRLRDFIDSLIKGWALRTP